MTLATSQSNSPFLANLPSLPPKTPAEWQLFVNALLAWQRSFSPSWTAATLQNGWVNYGGAYAAAAYIQEPTGIVRGRGLIRSGTVTDGTVLFTLPYPPQYEKVLVAMANNGSAYVTPRLDVDTLGNVSVRGMGAVSGTYWISLDQLTYSVAA